MYSRKPENDEYVVDEGRLKVSLSHVFERDG